MGDVELRLSQRVKASEARRSQRVSAENTLCEVCDKIHVAPRISRKILNNAYKVGEEIL